MLSKGVTLVTNALIIPVAIRYLGVESFGIWTTISTALAMLLVLDLGVANSLTNFISEAYAREDRKLAGTYSTTALAVMTFIAFLLGALAYILWPHIHWLSFFHLSSATEIPMVSHAMAAALIVFLFGLPASLAAKILGGYQELRTANIFTAAGSLLNLVAVVVLVRMHATLPMLVAGSSGALVATNLLCLAWIVMFRKPWLRPRVTHLSTTVSRRMMQLGSEFFVLQIAGLVVFNSDNLVVTHYLGPAEVATYSIAWRLVGYATVVQTLLTPALWPAFSEAFVRGDLEWIRRTFWRTMMFTMGTALIFSAVFAVSGRWIIQIWAGSAAVPTEGLLLLMCAWILISTFMNNTATVLVAKGQARLQAWCSLAATGVNLALSIYLVQRIGAPGVILATILSYVFVLIIPQTWQALRSLKASETPTVKIR